MSSYELPLKTNQWADGSALDRLRVSTINMLAPAADPAQPSPSIRLPRRPPRVIRDRGTP
jgi:hypothetical protein